MRAVDTNVVIRLIVADDKQQAKRASEAFATGNIFRPNDSVAGIRMGAAQWLWICAISHRHCVESDGRAFRRDDRGAHAFALALDWLNQGMDFADDLHLAKSAGCTAFFSGCKLAKVATGQSSVAVEQP